MSLLKLMARYGTPRHDIAKTKRSSQICYSRLRRSDYKTCHCVSTEGLAKKGLHGATSLCDRPEKALQLGRSLSILQCYILPPSLNRPTLSTLPMGPPALLPKINTSSLLKPLDWSQCIIEIMANCN